jgi:8-oxo-dGTP pyrophosphatase MutT (NUDIX family)
MNVKKSYGIILCRKNTRSREWEVLTVKKRNTYAFVEFILKKHIRTDEKRILFLLDNMTYDEKVDLLSLNFGQIWHRFQLYNPDAPAGTVGTNGAMWSPEDFEKYKLRKLNFERVFLSDKGKLLRRLISKSKNSINNWELPKGRRNGPEPELNCAIRETSEETDMNPVDYTLLVHEPLLKLIQSTSFVRYESYYYIGVTEDSGARPNHMGGERIVSGKPLEIAEVQWMTIDKLSIVDSTNKLPHIAGDALKIVRKKYKYDRILKINALT